MAGELDEMVTEFRNRPLDAGPYTYVWMDALTQKVREGGRTINVAVVIAVGVNADGHREILGVDVITTEDGAGWLAFLRGLVARGLTGVSLVISDAHPGLVDAIASTLPGSTWQRCRTHYMRNLLTIVPQSRRSRWSPRSCGRSSLSATRAVQAQHARVVEQLAERFPDAATHLADAADVLASPGSPRSTGARSGPTTPRNGYKTPPTHRRRRDLPHRDAVIRSSAPCSPNNTTNGLSPRYMGDVRIVAAWFTYRGVRSGTVVLSDDAVTTHGFLRTRRYLLPDLSGADVRIGQTGPSGFGREYLVILRADGTEAPFKELNSPPAHDGNPTTVVQRAAAAIRGAVCA